MTISNWRRYIALSKICRGNRRCQNSNHNYISKRRQEMTFRPCLYDPLTRSVQRGRSGRKSQLPYKSLHSFSILFASSRNVHVGNDSLIGETWAVKCKRNFRWPESQRNRLFASLLIRTFLDHPKPLCLMDLLSQGSGCANMSSFQQRNCWRKVKCKLWVAQEAQANFNCTSREIVSYLFCLSWLAISPQPESSTTNNSLSRR